MAQDAIMVESKCLSVSGESNDFKIGTPSRQRVRQIESVIDGDDDGAFPRPSPSIVASESKPKPLFLIKVEA